MSAEKDLQREIKFLTETAAAEQEEKLSISSEIKDNEKKSDTQSGKKDLSKLKVQEPENHAVIRKIANTDSTPNRISYAKKHNFEVDESMKEEKETEEHYLDSVMGNKYVKEIVDKTKDKANNGIFKKFDGKLNPIIGFIVKLLLLPYIFFRDYTRAFISMSDKAKRKKTALNFSTLALIGVAQIVAVLALEFFDSNPAYWSFIPIVIMLGLLYSISRK